MNMDKTVLFHAGLSSREISDNVEYGFSVGTLPVRYLGLPLMSRKLKISEYSPLLEKIISKLKGWAVKSLSFAGRSQLLKAVIYGAVNFWMTSFMLPKGCIRKIESLCSNFLWSGNIEIHSKSKVAWSTVCLPKSEGGLGLRRFSAWNTTLSLRLIWLLFSNSGSLWVAWHCHHHNLDSSSFWDLKPRNNDSWFWKGLLNLRGLARKFIGCLIGNGTRTWFWHDTWTPFGPLIDYLGDEGPRSLRIPLNFKVSEACNHEGWKLANPRSDKAVSLQVFSSSIDLPSSSLSEDSLQWVIENVHVGNYSASKTWEVLRPRDSEKSWANLVWFKGSTPKLAFNFWIANLNRLPTMSRLASWGLQVSVNCLLCSSPTEDRDHLFIHCTFTSVIWNKNFQRLRQQFAGFSNWSSLLHWAKVSTRSSPSTLRLLLAQALVYSVWRQRNNLLHNLITIQPITIFKDIDRQIVNTINARRKRKKFRNLMALWIN